VRREPEFSEEALDLLADAWVLYARVSAWLDDNLALLTESQQFQAELDARSAVVAAFMAATMSTGSRLFTLDRVRAVGSLVGVHEALWRRAWLPSARYPFWYDLGEVRRRAERIAREIEHARVVHPWEHEGVTRCRRAGQSNPCAACTPSSCAQRQTET
jgi:hypothetical protein